MLNSFTIDRIRKNLYNISSNLHAESYYNSTKGKKRKIKGYTPSQDATEAQEYYNLSLQSNEWDQETEEKIKGYIMRIRVYNNDLLLDNEEYWKQVINTRKAN